MFVGAKRLKNAVLALEEIFVGFIFTFSLDAAIGHTLMYHDPVSNFPLAWHFFTKNSDPAMLVGMLDFHHHLNRSHSPPFALCIYRGGSIVHHAV